VCFLDKTCILNAINVLTNYSQQNVVCLHPTLLYMYIIIVYIERVQKLVQSVRYIILGFLNIIVVKSRRDPLCFFENLVDSMWSTDPELYIFVTVFLGHSTQLK